jgi:hypothetical protein
LEKRTIGFMRKERDENEQDEEETLKKKEASRSKKETRPRTWWPDGG